MPQNALSNPLVLPILGLLIERSRHQYALLSELRRRYPFLGARTSTVYTLVGSLARHGLVDLDESTTESEPQQVSLTAAGATELRARVEQQLVDADPSRDPKFMMALAYLGMLTPERASALLRERVENLRAELRATTDTLDSLDTPELHMIEAHFLASRIEHDATWLTHLADRIEHGDLAWP